MKGNTGPIARAEVKMSLQLNLDYKWFLFGPHVFFVSFWFIIFFKL